MWDELLQFVLQIGSIFNIYYYSLALRFSKFMLHHNTALVFFGAVLGILELHLWDNWMKSTLCHIRVDTLAFLKPDFEILAFLTTFFGFCFCKKSQTFKAWLWQNIVWTAWYSLQNKSNPFWRGYLWPCRVHRKLQRLYCFRKSDRCY